MDAKQVRANAISVTKLMIVQTGMRFTDLQLSIGNCNDDLAG